MAFATRLLRIWRSLLGSPRRPVGIFTSTCNASSIPLARAVTAKESIRPSVSSTRSKSSFSSTTRSAASFEKSSMSLTIVSNSSPFDRMISVWRRCSGVRSESESSSPVPMIPASGVRISWLMLARKSDRRRAVSRARSRTRSRARFASSSARLRLLISTSTPS